jgi:hypothetical protein
VAGQLLLHDTGFELQRLGQLGGGSLLIFKGARIGGNGSGFDTHCHGLMMGVVNRTALAANHELFCVLILGLIGKPCTPIKLKITGAHTKCRQP